MRIDPEALEEVRAVLDDSPRVDAQRVGVSIEHDEVVLRGTVATPEEAEFAAMLAEEIVPAVVNELRVDPALREGTVDPEPTAQTPLPSDEVPLGGPDPLAGPEAGFTSDVQRSLDENEPLDPPDAPQAVATGDGLPEPPPDTLHAGDPDPDPLDQRDDLQPAAADLSTLDLRRAAEGGGSLPSLDPEAARDPVPGDERDTGSEAGAGARPDAGEAGGDRPDRGVIRDGERRPGPPGDAPP